MRASLWLCLLVIATGCAANRVAVRIISTDWAAVTALAPGTDVGVLVDGGEVHYGRVNEVTSAGMTLWEPRGLRVLPRARVERLAIRTPIGTARAPRIIETALIGAAIGGALAFLAGIHEENPGPGGSKWALVFGATALGAGIGSQRPPVERFREQVVYVRP